MAKVKTAKGKKRSWLPILAPESFNGMEIGETLVTEPEEAIGKSVTQSLMILTDDPRKQAYTIRFDVTNVSDGKARTQAIGMSMTPSAEKRLIRRHRDKITDSFVLKIAGGRLIRVKPMLVTRTRTGNSAQTRIRLTVREKLKDLWQKMRFDDIINDIIDMKVQRHLKDVCSKIHPIRSADIRQIIVLPEGREISEEMAKQIEEEAAQEARRRKQLEEAAQKASVSEQPQE